MIEVKNLSFGYKKRKLLYKNLNLSLPVGSIYGLLGDSSLKGYAVVMQNRTGEESKVNLEYLFNAVTENPAKAKSIFNTK